MNILGLKKRSLKNEVVSKEQVNRYIEEARNALLNFETQQYEDEISKKTKRLNNNNNKKLPQYDYLKNGKVKKSPILASMYKLLLYRKIISPTQLIDEALLSDAYDEAGGSAIYKKNEAVNAFDIDKTNQLIDLNYTTISNHAIGLLNVYPGTHLGTQFFISDGQRIFIIGDLNPNSLLVQSEIPIISLEDPKTNTLRKLKVVKYSKPISKGTAVKKYFSRLQFFFVQDKFESLLQASVSLAYLKIGDNLDVLKLADVVQNELKNNSILSNSISVTLKDYREAIENILRRYEKEISLEINATDYLKYID